MKQTGLSGKAILQAHKVICSSQTSQKTFNVYMALCDRLLMVSVTNNLTFDQVIHFSDSKLL